MLPRVPVDAAVVTAAEMRAAEEAVFARGVSGEDLMERAGLAVARETHRFATGAPVLVLAGPGNNGGDAYVAARHLARWGHEVEVAALDAPKTGTAAAMAMRWMGRTVAFAEAAPRPVLVDGLFGTGITRPLGEDVRGPLARFCAAARSTVAIDLPSGFASDDGDILASPARADLTVALGALKPAHVLFPASAACGWIRLVDIGVPACREMATIADPRIDDPAFDAHKYSRGMVVVLAGAMAGAARLAARAALRGGAGYVVLAGAQPDPAAPAAIVQRRVREADELAALLEDARISTVLIGPGLGRDARAAALLEAALRTPHRLVLDGDALTLLGQRAAARAREAETVLTPHSGEFVRMFGKGAGSKIERTLAAARAAGAIVVHKGPDTVAASPGRQARVLAWGNPWLATAGTGDVLAGLVAAAPPGLDGAARAIWLHARAAALAGPALIADDLPDLVGHVIRGA